MPEKERLHTWPEIQERLIEYIPAITGSYAALQKLSTEISGSIVTRLHADASIDKEGLKVTTTRGKGTFAFWVKPVFSGDRLALVSISSERGVAPSQVYSDLINPMADMLKRETSAKIEVKINQR